MRDAGDMEDHPGDGRLESGGKESLMDAKRLDNLTSSSHRQQGQPEYVSAIFVSYLCNSSAELLSV